MAVERRSPLPAGRYWVVVIGAPGIRSFDAWLSRYREQLNLRVLSSSLDSGGWVRPPSQFITFEVLRSGVVLWEGPGLPNIIPKGAPLPSRSDTAKRPDPPKSIIDEGSDLSQLGTLLFILGGLYLLNRSKRRR